MKRDIFTSGLAVAGTALVWLPLAAPVALALAGLTRGWMLQFDYLMPAELFPVALLGGILLAWSAFRARSHRAWIVWPMVTAVALLAGGMVAASVTGLASGAAEPAGWRVSLVLALVAAHAVALAVAGVAGLSLVRALTRAIDEETP